MPPLRGWGPKGERLIAKAPHGNWKTTTFIGALRHDRIDAPWVIDGPVNGELFTPYVEKVLAPTLNRGDAVILDNLSSHKGKAARQVIRGRGAHLIFLPPYRPDLNPIEQLFGQDQAAAAPSARARHRSPLAQARRTPHSRLVSGMRKLSQKLRICFRLKTAVASGSASKADNYDMFKILVPAVVPQACEPVVKMVSRPPKLTADKQPMTVSYNFVAQTAAVIDAMVDRTDMRPCHPRVRKAVARTAAEQIRIKILSIVASPLVIGRAALSCAAMMGRTQLRQFRCEPSNILPAPAPSAFEMRAVCYNSPHNGRSHLAYAAGASAICNKDLFEFIARMEVMRKVPNAFNSARRLIAPVIAPFRECYSKFSP
jgi:hypothetical protein